MLPVFAVGMIDQPWRRTQRRGARKHMLVRETLMVRIGKRRKYEIGIVGLEEPAAPRKPQMAPELQEARYLKKNRNHYL